MRLAARSVELQPRNAASDAPFAYYRLTMILPFMNGWYVHVYA